MKDLDSVCKRIIILSKGNIPAGVCSLFTRVKKAGIDLETRGGFYITQIKQRQERIFEKLLRENEIEISGGQGRILFVLWKNDNLTVSEISQKTSLAKNTVSLVVDRIVRNGILEKNTNPDNFRQTVGSLTEYAKRLQKTLSRYQNRCANFLPSFLRREPAYI